MSLTPNKAGVRPELHRASIAPQKNSQAEKNINFKNIRRQQQSAQSSPVQSDHISQAITRRILHRSKATLLTELQPLDSRQKLDRTHQSPLSQLIPAPHVKLQ